jgi:hypothetical protein
MILLSTDSHVVAPDLIGTFAGLMDLYERNYISLRCLVPRLPPVGSALLSQVTGGLDLHLTVNERFRYTSELLLTYHFHRNGSRKAEPNLRIRIYHDARLAEVMAAQLRHWPSFEAEGYNALRTRWRVNRFLYKWLHYCLHQGHRFHYPPN